MYDDIISDHFCRDVKVDFNVNFNTKLSDSKSGLSSDLIENLQYPTQCARGTTQRLVVLRSALSTVCAGWG